MSRWNGFKYSFVFTILFPRFLVFILLPYFILLSWPITDDYSFPRIVFEPGYARVVIVIFLLLFGLSVVANLSVSRYLRLHQTPASPYIYADDAIGGNYFRIRVTDKEAFKQLLKEMRRDHPREAIRFWLVADNLLWFPPVTVLLLFLLVFIAVPWLVKFAWKSLQGRLRSALSHSELRE